MRKRLSFIILISIITFSTAFDFSFKTLILAEETIKLNEDISCSNLPKDYVEPSGFNTLKDYVASLKIEASSGQTFLKNFILKGTTEGFNEFLKSVAGYVIMLTFCIIVFLSWVTLYICCCCNCCIFNDTTHMTCCCDKGTCGQCNKIFAMIYIGILVLASCVGLSYSKSFLRYFNGSLCSLLTFYDIALLGDPITTTPKWGGIQETNTAMGLLVEHVKKMKSSSGVLPDFSKADLQTKKKNNLETVDQLQKIDFSIDGPEEGNKINPTYAALLTDTSSKTSYISGILEEMNILHKSADSLINLEDLVKQIEETADAVQRVSTIHDLFTAFSDLMTQFKDKIGGNMIKIRDNTIYAFTGLFIFLFIIFILISLNSLGFLICYATCRCFCIRFFLHCYWGLLMALSITSCSVGSLIGILGVIGEESVPFITEVFSTEYLKSADSNFGVTKAASYMERCLNGNGDLANEMGLSTYGMYSSLEKYIESSVNVARSKEAFKSTSQSEKVASTKSKMSYYQLRDISSTAPQYSSTVDRINAELQNVRCPERYFILNQEPKDIELKAGNVPATITCGAKPVNIDNKVKRVYDSLVANDAKINNINTVLDACQNTFSDLLGVAQTEFDEVITMTEDFTPTFINSMGDGKFSGMLNCSIFKKELILFLDQLGVQFSSLCAQIAAFAMICSIGSYLLVFFIVRTICFYSEKSLSADMENDDGVEMEWQDVQFMDDDPI